MSYILDALRRADAERERGAVPGLHTQPVSAAGGTPAANAGSVPWAAAGGGAALVALLAALGWWLTQRQPAPAAAPAPALVSAPAPAIPPAPAPLPAPAPAPMAAAAPRPAAALRPASPAVAAAPAPVPPVRATPPAAATLPEPTRANPEPAPTTATATAPRILPWGQLPDEVRRQIPALAIGGAIHSDNAANRMLIVGGQLLHEGDSAAPGVVLEQIRPRSAVMRWRDLRYEVAF